MKMNDPAHLILIRTEEEALRHLIATVLENEGFKPLNAFDEHELFTLLEEFHPPIVILDAGLHRIIGLTVWDIIKKVERFRDINVILITSGLQSPSGADEHIERGHIGELLAPKIRKFIPVEPEMHLHEDAKRLARAIVSDIVLYNKEKAEEGAAGGTFYEDLRDEIEEGRRLYQSRMPGQALSTANFYDEAIENFIGKGSRGQGFKGSSDINPLKSSPPRPLK